MGLFYPQIQFSSVDAFLKKSYTIIIRTGLQYSLIILKHNTMNKAELAATIADKVGVSKKEGEEMVAAFVETVTTTLVSGGVVSIAGFGAFSAKLRAGRVGVNPQNPPKKSKSLQ